MYLDENNPLTPYEKQIDIKDRKKLVAQIIKGIRESKGYLQKDVADFIGIPLSTYSGYEIAKSETPIEILVRLSFLYNVPIDYLVGKEVFALEFGEKMKEQIDDVKSALEKIEKDVTSGILRNNEQAKLFADTLLQTMKELTQAMADSNDLQAKIANSKK